MHSFRWLSSLAAVFTLAVTLPSVGLTAPLAFPSAQETMNFSVEGKITRHAGATLTVNTEGNMIFRVVYNEKTEIAGKDKSAGSAKDLKVGVRIHVDGELTEEGEIIAKKIAILTDAGSGKNSSSERSTPRIVVVRASNGIMALIP